MNTLEIYLLIIWLMFGFSDSTRTYFKNVKVFDEYTLFWIFFILPIGVALGPIPFIQRKLE